MYSEWYEHISAPLRNRPAAVRTLNALDKGLVAIIAVGYIAAIIWMLVCADARVGRFIAVPAAGFVALSAVRAVLNLPRPYEAAGIDPLIKKDTQGKSCPSRHIFSAFVIAFALLWICVPAGIAAIVLGCIVCYCRIVGGVHFPRDVVAAVLFAAACAAIGFLLIP